MNSFESIKLGDKKYIEGTYARYDFAVQNGNGASCYDVGGKKYIDFSSGIGVNSLGFAHPDWVKAVAEQAGKAAHVSNYFYSPPTVALATMLCENTGYEKAFFCNSGAEANECAIKTARKRSFDKYCGSERTKNPRSNIITMKNSFHGRTMTTLTATGQDSMHNYFHPFAEGFIYAEPNNIEDFKSKIDENTCGVMIELIQGEGGVNSLDFDYVKQIASLCEEHDLVLIADEVQTGVGRTGKFLCCEHYGIMPDIITLAKGLGGGLPIGAVLFRGKACGVLKYGDHGTTFGGNPLASAGACVVMEKISDKAFLDDVIRKGEKFKASLEKMEKVKKVVGSGLMIGIELHGVKSPDIMKKCLENGLIVLTAKEKTRFLPPLVITDGEIEEGLEIFNCVLKVC